MITRNFAAYGGVGYINNDGIALINKGTTITRNSALNTCLLFSINSNFPSIFDNVTIYQNDQINGVFNKSQIFNLNDAQRFISLNYIDYL